MDPKPPPNHYVLAPPASGSSAAMQLPAHEGWPDVDQHLVKPETREELVRDRQVWAQPANPPHGDRHNELDYVVRGSVAPGYISSTDLLTRVGSGSNFATDTCIRREGIDPSTGKRWLEELAFEVVSEQSLDDITERAEDLTTRGVRRMFAIFVKKGEVCEWSTRAARWQRLDLEDLIVDPTLAQPLQVCALLEAVEADNAVVRALKAKKNPAIAELEAASRQRALEQVCEILGLELAPDEQNRLGQLDADELQALLDRRSTK